MMWKKKNNDINTVEEVFRYNMKICSLEEVNDWFRRSYADEYKIESLHEAAEFVLGFKNSQVYICGDYDADGITSTSILYITLAKMLGFENVSYMIPGKVSEGFGINMRMLDEMRNDNGNALILTCDNGIAQVEVLDKAKKRGFNIVVLDHHQPKVVNDKVVLPDADFIIDPSGLPGTATFSGYCGAGLAYRFCMELLKCSVPDYKTKIWSTYTPSVLLSLAAIGTVGDVMELREENYVIVRNALKTLRKHEGCTPGMYALMQAFDLISHLCAKDIGFSIAPCLNACERMHDGDATNMVDFIVSDMSSVEADKLVKEFIEINECRKQTTKELVAIAEHILDTTSFAIKPIIPKVLYLPNANEGIMGIIAGKLTERYKIPFFVVTDSKQCGILKGSGRSFGNYNIKEELDNVADCFVNYGGHMGAAGVTFEKDRLDEVQKRLSENLSDYDSGDLDSSYYDLDISPKDIADCLGQMVKFEPYGEYNFAPVFRVEFECSNVKFMGKNGSTVKLTGTDFSAISFDQNLVNTVASMHIDSGDRICVYGTLEYNYFRSIANKQILFTGIEKLN